MKNACPKFFFAGMTMVLLAGAAFALPPGAKAVQEIDTARYLGKWYEIARLDFAFEKGLNNTTAEYSLETNGTIKVVNRGFDVKRNKWKKAEGRARFRTNQVNGELEVSFFGPFYSEYNIVALDPDYRYALVIGVNAKYMWILSREPTIPDDVRNEYVSVAQSIGVRTDDLVWVEHTEGN